MKTIHPKVNELLNKAKAIEWLLKQGRQEHSSSCNYEDPDSYGPCTCGYHEDKHNRDYLVSIITDK